MRNDGPRNYHRQGGWINFAIQAGLALFGASQSKKAGKAAGKDRARELELQDRQLQISESQEARAAELYGDYRRVYQPREEALVSEAFDRQISPGRAEAMATKDVRSSLSNARSMSTRRLRRLGVNPASGRYRGIERQTSLDEAAIEAGARTSARDRTRGENFERQSSVLQMGRGLPATAGALSGSASAGVGRVASLAGARARSSEGLAYDTGVGTGRALGEAIDAGVELWKNRKTGSSTESPRIDPRVTYPYTASD